MSRSMMLLLAFPGWALAAPTIYAFTDESTLDARVYKAGVASGLAHDHVIRAGALTGRAIYDPERLDQLQLEVVVPTESLKPDAPRVRHQYGLPADIGTEDRAKIEENLKADDQLAIKRFPEIRFRLTLAARVGDQLVVEGDLTLRGRTKRVNLPVKIEADGRRFVGTGELRVTHRDFGFKPYSAALGAVRNQEKIDLILRLVGVAAP